MFWRVILLSVFFISCVTARPQQQQISLKLDFKDGLLTNINRKNNENIGLVKPVERTSFDIENELVNETTKVSYEGAQLWKIVVDNNAKRALIWQLKMDGKIQTWGGNATTVDVLVYRPYVNEVTEILKSANVDYVVNILNLQRAIDLENPLVSPEDEELTNRNGHRMTWNAYHRLSDIYGYLDYLATTYPSLCTVKTIGKTVQGREMKVLKISNGNPGNKAIWVDGGIHAREWISPASVTYIINTIVENYETESEDIKNTDLYFIAVANPDGYEYSHTNDRLWRKNRGRAGVCTGTDLNRNYGYHWGGKGSSKNPCTETYGGSAGFSEPETAAIRDFILNSGIKFVASISYHSYGQYILYPWGYDRFVTSDRNDLHRVGVKAAEAMRNVGGVSFTVGPAATTLYPAAGGSDDWAKGVANIKYAYTIELRDTGRYGFILPAQYIITSGKEALAAFRVIVAAGKLI